MLKEDLKKRIVDHLLPLVQTPAQYIGGEWNAVCKDHRSVGGTLCLAFPDAYSIGMSHHGLQVLYDVMNRRDWACERVFAPLADMEQLLRQHRLPLYSLETFTPLWQFDVLGFTLQYDSVQQRTDDARPGRHPLGGGRANDGSSAGDRRRAVRGEPRADGPVHRSVRDRRRRRGAARSVRPVGEV